LVGGILQSAGNVVLNFFLIGTFFTLALFHFYSHWHGGILPDSASVREFLRHTIRYFFLMGIGLLGSVYELLTSDNIRWLLLGGYGFAIVASAYRLWAHKQQNAEADEND